MQYRWISRPKLCGRWMSNMRAQQGAHVFCPTHRDERWTTGWSAALRCNMEKTLMRHKHNPLGLCYVARLGLVILSSCLSFRRLEPRWLEPAAALEPGKMHPRLYLGRGMYMGLSHGTRDRATVQGTELREPNIRPCSKAEKRHCNCNKATHKPRSTGTYDSSLLSS